MTAILALDQGTSSTRAIVFTLDGEILATAQQPLQNFYPRNGWVEQDATTIWQAQLDTARQAMSQAGQTISAIGITNQRETVVLWERSSGKPLHHAIVWQDRRGSEHCAQLQQQLQKNGHDSFIKDKTGLVLDPYFSATKIAWLLDHIPHARQRAAAGELACGTIDTWLLYNLSEKNKHLTDVSNASRTSLMNINTLSWDEELCALFDIPLQILPTIVSSAEIYHHCDLFSDLQSGSIPIAGMAGDQQAALFGQRCCELGMLKCTYGTGAFIMSQSGSHRQDVDGLLSTVAWKIGDQPVQYALEGAVFSAGSAVAWLRDGLNLIQNSCDIEALAAQASDSNDLFFVPAFNGLGTPHWDPQARGCFIGITQATRPAHFARACLDAIAHQVTDVIDLIKQAQPLREMRVDGAAAQNNLLLQIQAGLAGLPIQRAQQGESTALGAVWLAAIGAGLCSNDDLHWRGHEHMKPLLDPIIRQQQRQRWQQAVARSQHWADNAP